MGCGILYTIGANRHRLARARMGNWRESAQVGARANGELARIGANRCELAGASSVFRRRELYC